METHRDAEQIASLAERHTQEILGSRQSLPADESAIAWNRTLTHEQKISDIDQAARGRTTSTFPALGLIRRRLAGPLEDLQNLLP